MQWRDTTWSQDLADVPATPGVYALLCLAAGMVYVGISTRGRRARCREHCRQLRANAHPNAHMNEHARRYGHEAFWFAALDDDCEETAIARFRSSESMYGYNLT